MDIVIRRLTPALADDFFDFFEHRAFTDDSPYRCYCQMYQMTMAQEKAALDNAAGADMGRVAREIAEEQIQAGILQGYLAFADGVAIGWCNANDRASYPMDSRTGARFHAPAERREKAVVCFEIAPEYRRMGIATALLQQVLADAKAEGYRAVEAFPAVRNERFEWDSPGPMRLYENAGFVKAAEREDYAVMRIDLS